MKYKLTFALVAALTSTAFAEFKAPLPEFKNEKQLAVWRAEKASEATGQGYATEETAFYTGKPYLASSGGYAFKFRSYNPELARWTSEDPSGFPDGANNVVYAPNPGSELDPYGLMKVNGGSFDPGEKFSGSFPGFFNYGEYRGDSIAFADGAASGGSGSIELESYIWGYTTFSAAQSVTRAPSIEVSIDPNGNLQYKTKNSFGGADGVVGTGLSFTVEGTGSKALTFHIYGAWALSATGVSGVGLSASGGSISFAGQSRTDGPVALGTFQFIVE